MIAFGGKCVLVTCAAGGIGRATCRSLASELAAFVTGETIHVNGGWYIAS